MKNSKKTRLTINIVFVVIMLILLSVSAFMWLDMARYNKTEPQVAFNDLGEVPPAAAEDAVSDNSAENTAKKNGNGYSQDGIDVAVTGCHVKAGADTKQVTVTFSFTNNSESAFAYSNAGWLITLSDGTTVDPMSYITDFNPRYISSEETIEDEITFEISSSSEITSVKATYQFLNYTDEILFDMSKIIVGEMTTDEFLTAHPDMKAMDFTLKLQ